MNKMMQLLAMTALCLFCLAGSGCVVSTYYSGYADYEPPQFRDARQLQNTGIEEPWGYRPVYW